MVPDDGDQYWPTLGPQVCDFIERYLVHGPGDLRGQPVRLDDEKRALIYRMYEVYPKGHPLAGRRRFKRVFICLPKGVGKTELAAWIAAVELHPEGPVRTVGWTKSGEPIGGPVTDPYIPMVAYTEEQSDELAYGALKTILEESPLRDDFDIGLERIMRRRGDGKAVSLASAPSARDGARTTFQVCDEPLALDTKVPTPTGWTTIGEIKPGDVVFGRDGRPVRVLGVSEIHTGRPCYRVTFGDGTSIVADARHRWKVYDRSPNYRCERVVTTEEMAKFTWRHAARFKVVRPGPLQLPNVPLPVDPYFLGLWLGDGDSRNATVAAGKDDLPEIKRLIEEAGLKVTECDTKGRTPLLYVTFQNSRFSGFGATRGEPDNYSVVGELRKLGLLGNKHIPNLYLRAGTAQRLALLQGLMDSDGHIDPKGRCAFVNSNERLVDDVIELLRTLGYRPRPKVKKVDPRWGEPKVTYAVHFQADPSMPPFRLSRKRERIQRRVLDRDLAVVSVEPVPSVPVRCIAVDNEDHLFLAGDGMFPTHNTHWWTTPRLRQAHTTMMANLPKRKAADAWVLEITTAPEPGAGSVAEDAIEYARAVADGRVKDAKFFFFWRYAGDGHDLETEEGFRAAVIEASGAAAAWRDIDAIVDLWRDPTADKQYFERVWLNRLVRSGRQAFDIEKWRLLARSESPVKDGDLITIGFDGAQFHDSTAIVCTHVETGYQWLAGLWECPFGQEKTWQVPAEEVDAVIADLFERYDVWRMYADPPYWQSWVAAWAGRYGEQRVVEWWTNRRKAMAYALEAFETAINEGAMSHSGDRRLERHLGNARRKDLPQKTEDGRPLWLIQKERPDSPHKIDAAMAAVLSWEARRDAIAAGVLESSRSVYEERGRIFL